jgi:predicted DNA-binding transcriptional regulator AlpA
MDKPTVNESEHTTQDCTDLGELLSREVERLTTKYNKDFLCCEDLMKITGVGRDNVTAMMNDKSFPLVRMGNRKIVSVLSFVIWQHNKKEIKNEK